MVLDRTLDLAGVRRPSLILNLRSLEPLHRLSRLSDGLTSSSWDVLELASDNTRDLLSGGLDGTNFLQHTTGKVLHQRHT